MDIGGNGNEDGRPGNRTPSVERSKRGAAPRHSVASIALPAVSQSATFDPSLWTLKPTGLQGRRLAAMPHAAGRRDDALLELAPKIESEPVAPASFSQLKALRRSPLRFPAGAPEPAKLIAIDPARAAAHAARESARAAPPRARAAAAAAAAGSAPTVEIAREAVEPLWHALFAPSAGGPAERRPAPPPRPSLPPLERTRSSDDWASAGDIEVADLTDSRDPFAPPRIQPPRRPLWAWQWIEGLFLSKTFARALAAATIVLFVSAVDTPWREWVNRQAGRITTPIAAALDELSRPVQERAAFFIVDDFTAGIDHWVASRGLRVDPAGWLTVGAGVSLNGDTVRLQDYRLDFDAKIQSSAVGWIVRAPDTSNYYAFKLRQGGTERAPVYTLSRYALLDGVKVAATDGIPVPAHLARADDFNRVSVRVIGDRVTTLINGWGVDHWRQDALPRGGVGLLADAGESALVRKMTISGNDDTWGMILYGALESMNSLRTALGRGTAPAAIVFLRPIGPAAPPAPFER